MEVCYFMHAQQNICDCCNGHHLHKCNKMADTMLQSALPAVTQPLLREFGLKVNFN